MGTWGVGAFENDTAADWAFELEATGDLALVAREIDAILQAGKQYLEVDQACCALAACEVVARLKGNWGPRDAYSEPVDDWVEAFPQAPPPELMQAALVAIDRIVRRPSELLELWEEDDPAEWLAAVAELRKRVEG